MELTIRGDFTAPDGWEFTGEYRPPRGGETYYADPRHEATTAGRDMQYSYLILRPKWKPPTWLKDGTWIAMDADGEWYGFTQEPQVQRFGPGQWNDGTNQCVYLSSLALNFTPPPCTDWRESKRQIRHG